jgi:surface antigen
MIEQLAATRTSRIVTLGLSLAFALGAYCFGSPTASAERGPNPYPFGKSTYWAWQNRPDLPANLGEAKDWNDKASAQGWPVSQYPRNGDVAVFEPGVLGADRMAGHLAVVGQVFDNGTYTTTQMDEADCQGNSPNCGRVVTRQYTMTGGTSFIHYLKDTRTTWGFASGAAGWTPINLGAGAPDGPGWYYPLTGGSPQLVSPDLDIPLAAYNAIEIQMATSQAVTKPTMQIYFATASQPQFATTRRALLGTTPDGALHTYIVFCGANAEWKGQLTRLRLDPTGAGSAGGVRIERIRLLSEASPAFIAIAALGGNR